VLKIRISSKLNDDQNYATKRQGMKFFVKHFAIKT